MIREEDLGTGYHVWRAKIVEWPPLEKWASITGECIHSLRSALDHTAFELVRINQPTTEKTEFPIFKDRSLWEAEHARKLPGVAPGVLTEVERVQPYNGGDVRDRLWIVNALDIIDKHRRLNLVSPSLLHAEWEPIGGQLEDVRPFYGPFEDGAVVARFKLAPYYAAMHVKTEFAFDIAFGEGEELAREPVMGTLEALLVYVGGVIARFDRFFA
jgi:hypothetical protein